MRRPSDLIADRLTETGSTRPIALFRIAIGALLYMRFGQELSLHAQSSLAEMAFSLAYFACAALVFAGLLTRVALIGSAALLAAMYYGHFFGWTAPGWGHHHHYLLMLCCLVLSMSNCGRSFSVDRALDLRRAERSGATLAEERAPTWPQSLLVLQLAMIYFWTAIDKTSPGYMRGEWLERIMEWVYLGNPAYEFMTHRAFLVVGSWAVLIVEYVLPFAILLRWRLSIAIPAAFALHASFYVLLPVQTYSATMIALYLLVVDPDWLNAQMDKYVFGKTPAHA